MSVQFQFFVQGVSACENTNLKRTSWGRYPQTQIEHCQPSVRFPRYHRSALPVLEPHRSGTTQCGVVWVRLLSLRLTSVTRTRYAGSSRSLSLWASPYVLIYKYIRTLDGGASWLWLVDSLVTIATGYQTSSTSGVRLPWWLSGRESACQCRKHGFDPWSRKT